MAWKLSNVIYFFSVQEKKKIRVVPNAPKSRCVGEYGDGVKVKIAAPAMDGKANAELVKYLAKALGVSRACVRIVSGETSRDKLVEISGAEGAKDVLLSHSKE